MRPGTPESASPRSDFPQSLFRFARIPRRRWPIRSAMGVVRVVVCGPGRRLGTPSGLSVAAGWRMSKSHADLVDLVQRGYRFAYSLTHNAARAEDLVQDAWLSVLRISGPWTRQYLFAAIRNRFVDECRRRQIVGFETLDELSEPSGAATGPSASDVWDDAIDAAGLEQALGALRSEERAVLFLAAVEGYTAREIAELLGCPRGSVLSLMHRARERAREYLRGPKGATA